MKRASIALLSGSITLLIAYNLFNLCNLIYQVSMARLLTPIEYGVLATAFSFLYVLGIASDAIQTATTTYVSQAHKPGKIHYFFSQGKKKLISFAIGIMIFCLLLAWPLAIILKMPYALLALVSIASPFILFLPLFRGILQGTEQFTKLGFNLVWEALLKITAAICLVILGWGVYGALGGVIIATFLSLPFAYYQLKPILQTKEEKYTISTPLTKTVITFIFLGAIVGFYSLDLFIARALFSEEIAGNYALAAVLGKIVLWGTLPISKAFLPLAVKSPRERKKILVKSFSLTLFLLLGALIVFYTIPQTVTTLFTGKELPLVNEILFSVAFAMSILALLNLYLMYLLATFKDTHVTSSKVKGIIGAIVLGLVSEGLILFSSGKDLSTFANGLIISAIALSVYVITARQLTK